LSCDFIDLIKKIRRKFDGLMIMLTEKALSITKDNRKRNFHLLEKIRKDQEKQREMNCA